MSTTDVKTAIVTGAGRGLGRGIAQRLADDGFKVVIADLNEADATATAGEIGAQAVGLGCDVADHDSVNAMVSSVVDTNGRVDVLVNNAGWDQVATFMELDHEVWHRIIGVNLIGVLNVTKAVLPVMIGGGGGSIVNLGSDAGRVGTAGEAVYSATKGGVIAFTKSLAREVAREQIRVNCVSPGPSATQMFENVAGDNERLRTAIVKAIPMRRLGMPEDIAAAVSYLASADAAYVTGQTLSINGGMTMV